MPRGYGKFRRKRERDPRAIPLRVARRASGARPPSFEDFVTTDRIELDGTISYRDLVEARRAMWGREVRFPTAELDINFDSLQTATEVAAAVRAMQSHGVRFASTPRGVTNPWVRWVRTEGRAV